MIVHVFFLLNLIKTLRSTDWRQGAGKLSEPSKIFLFKNDVFDCVYYFI